jgi:drug/metabolite transporter (DMT)-like permease
MFLAGSSVIAGKLMTTIPIFLSQTISSLIAIIIIYPIANFFEGSIKNLNINKNDIFFLILQALTGNFLFRVFLILGLRYTNSMDSGIILGTSPIVLIILSYFILGEKIKKKVIIASILCAFSIILLKNTNINDHKHSFSTLGYVLIFLAVISEALFTIIQKKHSINNKPITTTAIIMIFSFILFCPFGAYELLKSNNFFLDPIHIGAILYYSIFCSVIAYICWFSGMKKIMASSAAIFTGVMPLSTVVLSIIFLKEKLYWNHLFGLIFVVISIYLVTSKKKFIDIYNKNGYY